KLGAYIIVPAFNLIGLPLSVYFAYGPPAMEVVGLWWGTCAGTVISALLQLFFIVYRTDWDREVERCLRRLISSGPAGSSAAISVGGEEEARGQNACSYGSMAAA
ncbi:hypothetical protein GQ54DRAFT_312409, partial [Martensiomyces pterosporus]